MSYSFHQALKPRMSHIEPAVQILQILHITGKERDQRLDSYLSHYLRCPDSLYPPPTPEQLFIQLSHGRSREALRAWYEKNATSPPPHLCHIGLLSPTTFLLQTFAHIAIMSQSQSQSEAMLLLLSFTLDSEPGATRVSRLRQAHDHIKSLPGSIVAPRELLRDIFNLCMGMDEYHCVLNLILNIFPFHLPVLISALPDPTILPTHEFLKRVDDTYRKYSFDYQSIEEKVAGYHLLKDAMYSCSFLLLLQSLSLVSSLKSYIQHGISPTWLRESNLEVMTKMYMDTVMEYDSLPLLRAGLDLFAELFQGVLDAHQIERDGQIPEHEKSEVYKIMEKFSTNPWSIFPNKAQDLFNTMKNSPRIFGAYFEIESHREAFSKEVFFPSLEPSSTNNSANNRNFRLFLKSVLGSSVPFTCSNHAIFDENNRCCECGEEPWTFSTDPTFFLNRSGIERVIKLPQFGPNFLDLPARIDGCAPDPGMHPMSILPHAQNWHAITPIPNTNAYSLLINNPNCAVMDLIEQHLDLTSIPTRHSTFHWSTWFGCLHPVLLPKFGRVKSAEASIRKSFRNLNTIIPNFHQLINPNEKIKFDPDVMTKILILLTSSTEPFLHMWYQAPIKGWALSNLNLKDSGCTYSLPLIFALLSLHSDDVIITLLREIFANKNTVPMSLNHTLKQPSKNKPIVPTRATCKFERFYWRDTNEKPNPDGAVKAISPLQFIISRHTFVNLLSKLCSRNSVSSYLRHALEDMTQADTIAEVMIQHYIDCILDGDVDQIHQPFTSTLLRP